MGNKGQIWIRGAERPSVGYFYARAESSVPLVFLFSDPAVASMNLALYLVKIIEALANDMAEKRLYKNKNKKITKPYFDWVAQSL